MTLATHIVIAAAVAKPLVEFNPIFPFLAAVASHYLSDAIPHWDYRLDSIKNPEDSDKKRWEFSRESLLNDFFKVLFDGILGTGALLLIMKPSLPEEFFLAGIIVLGSILPDFLEGIYMNGRIAPLRRIHYFHDFMHTKIRLGPYPLIGIPFQIVIFLIAIYFLI